LETQWLKHSSPCGELIGLAAERNGILRGAVKLSIEDPLLRILKLNLKENTIGQTKEHRSTSGRKFQDFGEIRWTNNAISMENK